MCKKWHFIRERREEKTRAVTTPSRWSPDICVSTPCWHLWPRSVLGRADFKSLWINLFGIFQILHSRVWNIGWHIYFSVFVTLTIHSNRRKAPNGNGYTVVISLASFLWKPIFTVMREHRFFRKLTRCLMLLDTISTVNGDRAHILIYRIKPYVLNISY